MKKFFSIKVISYLLTEKAKHKKNHVYLTDPQYSTWLLKKESRQRICHKVDIYSLAKRLTSFFC